MLKPNEYMPFAPDSPGRVRVNHTSGSCSGKSNSMVVVRENDGNVSAKCFRCGEWGKSWTSPKPSMMSVPKSKPRSMDMPTDLEFAWNLFPVEATTYLNKFKFNVGHTATHGIGWSPSLNRLVIPIRNHTHGEVGWLARSFSEEPRYWQMSNTPAYMWWSQHDTGLGDPEYDGAVLIVEDTLSAIRGSELLSSFALLGTELSHKMLRELSAFDTFYIWLDNDNAIVRAKQRQLRDRLNLFGDAKLILSDCEVKELDLGQVEKVLRYI